MLQRMSVVACQIFFVSETAQVVLHVRNCVAVLNNAYATFVSTACYDITANPSYHILIANTKATKPITETPKPHWQGFPIQSPNDGVHNSLSPRYLKNHV